MAMSGAVRAEDPMKCHCIRYTEVPRTSPLFLDYHYHYDRLAPFYNGSPFDLASYQAVAGSLPGSWSAERKALAEILERQNRAFGAGELTLANVRRLGEPGTFAVVTGQQVGLLSGPAFTLYKALSAIRLAQFLSHQGLPTVPVFWLATEDHDLEEVSKTAILNGDGNLVELRDPGERPALRSSVGYVKLTGAMTTALDQMEFTLAQAPASGPGEEGFRDRLLGDLRETYQSGTTWGHAFGAFLTRLFSRWGVVMIDPLDEGVHRLAAPVYGRALDQAEGLRARLKERSQELVRAGYHAQVHLGDDSTLLFLEREGNRLPIHRQAGSFSLDGSRPVELVELEALVDDRPILYSPNALFRPIVQDFLLPTVAYVAGPSEIAYWAQSQAIYPEFGRPMPVLFPRAAFTLVDRRTHKLMEKYRVGVEDAWQGEEHLGLKIAATGFAAGWSERLDQSEDDLRRLLERLRGDIESLDPTLLDTLKHAEEKMEYQMERLRGKITRAALQRSELLERHQQTLLRFLAPARDLQEREVGGIYFLARAGYELLDRLLERVHTNSSDHQVLEY